MGGIVAGLARTEIPVATAGMQGTLEGQNIAFQRYLQMAQAQREAQLGQAQQAELYGRAKFYGDENDTRQSIADTRAGGQVAAADTRAGGARDVAAINSGSRETIAGGNNNTKLTLADASNAAKIRIANINAQSRTRAASIRLRIAAKGPSASVQLRAVDQRGQALLSQYPDDKSLTDAEVKDPTLSARLDQPDPATGVTLRDAYHVAQQASGAKTAGNLARMYGGVPNPTKVTQDAQALGITTPAPSSMGGTTATPAPPQRPNGNVLGTSAPVGQPLPPVAPGPIPASGLKTAPTAPAGGGLPGTAGLPLTPSAAKPVRTAAQMNAFLASHPDVQRSDYLTAFTVAPDAAQATPGQP